MLWNGIYAPLQHIYMYNFGIYERDVVYIYYGFQALDIALTSDLDDFCEPV